MEQSPLVQQLRQIARSYDLEALLRDVSDALDAAPEQDRAFVPCPARSTPPASSDTR
jgi:hypothetical protein